MEWEEIITSTNVGPIIKTIIDMLGEETVNDHKRFLSLLDDLAPELTNERKIFHRVITQETLSFLLELNCATDAENDLLKAKKRLEDDYGLSASWSILIVSGFADAFGISSIILDPKDDEKSIRCEQENKESHSVADESSVLFRRREQLVKERSSLGLFSSRKKAEIDKQIAEIDAICRRNISPSVEASSQVTKEYSRIPSNQITKIEFFSSDGTVSGRKIFGTTFLKGETSYIGVKVFFDKNESLKNVDLNWRIYNENGTPFTNENNISVPLGPTEESVFHQWGWNSPGNWPVGKYRVIASINRGNPVSAWFDIKPGNYDVLPFGLKNVKLFNGGIPAPTMEQREYTNVFHKSTAKYIYFQLEFTQPCRDILTTFEYSIFDENGHCVVNAASPVEIKSNYGVYWNGYGWNTPGGWKPGRYTYSVSLGKAPALTGCFEIRG